MNAQHDSFYQFVRRKHVTAGQHGEYDGEDTVYGTAASANLVLRLILPSCFESVIWLARMSPAGVADTSVVT
jgi:hypothetical protein